MQQHAQDLVMDPNLINPLEYERARSQLGAAFTRILGYFREDGIKSVEEVEVAMRDRNSAALVIPAHTLKGESRQFGSVALGNLAEKIEMTARRCVELRTGPEDLVADVADLRRCFTRTLNELERHSGQQLTVSKPSSGFGRRPTASLTALSRG